MNTSVASGQPAFEFLAQQLSVPVGDTFLTARTLVAMIEAAASQLSKVDQVQLGRLMTAAGHEIGINPRRPCRSTKSQRLGRSLPGPFLGRSMSADFFDGRARMACQTQVIHQNIRLIYVGSRTGYYFGLALAIAFIGTKNRSHATLEPRSSPERAQSEVNPPSIWAVRLGEV